jgi:myo-inositol-1-phosphate synthase
LGYYLSQIITKAEGPTADIVDILRRTKTDVVVNYLPVGSEEATKWYVEQVLRVPCAFVNCIPVFIAREAYWQRRFRAAGVPIVGDDIKSQVGATIVHRVLTRLFRERGVKLERTSQLNVGGNTDFLNMLERSRLESKKISKTNAVTSQLDYDIGAKNVHIGPSDYVEWLDDRKWAYIRMEGRTFGDVPLNVELKLEVWDSPNSAGVVIDAVRCAKLALDNGVAGALIGPSAYFKKSPPRQFTDEEARRLTEEFIAEMASGSAGRKTRDGKELAAAGLTAERNGRHGRKAPAGTPTARDGVRQGVRDGASAKAARGSARDGSARNGAARNGAARDGSSKAGGRGRSGASGPKRRGLRTKVAKSKVGRGMRPAR